MRDRDLPLPSEEAQRASAQLSATILREIDAAGGWISFERFMQMALYTPGLGYYSGGATKLGPAGDFVTAPEISPLFASALAPQVVQIMDCSAPMILELGAGSGILAAQLLCELEHLGTPPLQYSILEVSAALRARQEQTIAERAPHWLNRVRWLDSMEDRIEGAVLGNEVLDALPVHILEKSPEGAWLERGVCMDATRAAFQFASRAAESSLIEAMLSAVPMAPYLPASYLIEFHHAANAMISTLVEKIEAGVALFFDYGFPESEYYHPQRVAGTLMAHYRHRAHADPFLWPGLQDLTAHVNFSGIAQSAHAAGADILGFCSQAHFLLNSGIATLVEGAPTQTMQWARQAQGLQTLLSEAEMGELFKVICLGRGVDVALTGFSAGDRIATL